VLLHCPVEVDEMFRPGTRDAPLGKKFLLGSLGLDAPGVSFYAHPPKGVLKSHQSILPHGDGAFPAI
jgi:hypothetical protein